MNTFGWRCVGTHLDLPINRLCTETNYCKSHYISRFSCIIDHNRNTCRKVWVPPEGAINTWLPVMCLPSRSIYVLKVYLHLHLKVHLSAITCTKEAICFEEGTLGPAYNEHPTATSKFLCIKIIDSNVNKFGYNEQPLRTNSSFCIFPLVVSWDPVCNRLYASWWHSFCQCMQSQSGVRFVWGVNRP